MRKLGQRFAQAALAHAPRTEETYSADVGGSTGASGLQMVYWISAGHPKLPEHQLHASFGRALVAPQPSNAPQGPENL